MYDPHCITIGGKKDGKRDKKDGKADRGGGKHAKASKRTTSNPIKIGGAGKKRDGKPGSLASATADAKKSDSSRYVKRHSDGTVTVHDSAPDGAHYRVSPGGSLLHVDGGGHTKPVPAAARPAVERSLSGDHDQDSAAAREFPAASTDVEARLTQNTDYNASADQRKALRRYTGNGYRGINGLLRGHLETDAERDRYRPMVDDLNRLFDDYPPLAEDVTVLRGLTDAGWLPSDASGETIVNRGFVSTSFDPGVANSFADDGTVFEVRVPAGFKALPAAGVFESDEQEEHELVLPHGTLFSVRADETRTVNNQEVRWLTVDALPPTEKTARVP